ncbi:MAG TPA: hypothetical protein VGQ81_15065, partial [Acidobacteriota bacterium]|nr:hypothetical protein [Acidobacteriota bacterium]
RAILAFSLIAASSLAKRLIQFDDFPAAAQRLLAKQGVDERRFDGYTRSINIRTEARMLEGENDHLIYYVLQSRRFTRQPGIEPALSAYAFVQELTADEKSRYWNDSSYLPPIERLPQPVFLRFQDFTRVLKKSGTWDRSARDERLVYFQDFIQKNKNASESLVQYLYRQYARSMKFLYQKEFSAQKNVKKRHAEPLRLAVDISSLYQTRGHSTDTQIEANFAVYIALGALKAERPALQLNKVLIVGPGIDFAPRTDLMDIFGPQSYQPYAVADALFAFKLAALDRVRIDCVDINDRVVRFVDEFSREESRRLALISGVADNAKHSFTAEYRDYFKQLGKSIGFESPLDNLPSAYASRLKKSILVKRDLAGKVSAGKLNIITERYDPSPGYDLIVVTNVFLYFNDKEILLSLANIESMMKKGAYLIHNEPRQNLVSFAALYALPVVQARTVLIAPGETPLYDTVWVHRRQ